MRRDWNHARLPELLAHHFTPDGLLASDICLLSYNAAFTGRWQEDWVVRHGKGLGVM